MPVVVPRTKTNDIDPGIIPGLTFGIIRPGAKLMDEVVDETAIVLYYQMLKDASDQVGPDRILSPAKDRDYSRKDSPHQTSKDHGVAIVESTQGIG